MEIIPIKFWAAFNLVILMVMFIDLKYIQKDSHPLGLKKAFLWYFFCMALAAAFNLGVYKFMGREIALQFLTGYIVETSLSIDNLFVFILIFQYFNVSNRFQPRVLHWGILGALVMRFAVIAGGSALLNAFHWIFYVFGVLIIVTAVRILMEGDKQLEPEKNPAIKLFKKFMPISIRKIEDDKFFVHENGRWAATPLFIALLMVESSDLVFAVDSIPAIFAITTNTFIVYTSNVFAILGLRALYFILAGVLPLFVYLKYGISIVLCYVGVKMLIMEFVKIPTPVSLSVVVGVLTASVLASWIWGQKKEKKEPI